MLKRLFAILFIIALTGQVWAGVCLCLDTGEEDAHAKMSCCKREKAQANQVSARPCCDEPCGETNGNKLPFSPSESNNKIPAPVLNAIEKFINSFNRKPNYTAPLIISKRSGDRRLQLSHSPDFYLQNHAFLI
jgi:hypothetical protein